eukprot:gene2125-23515_t
MPANLAKKVKWLKNGGNLQAASKEEKDAEAALAKVEEIKEIQAWRVKAEEMAEKSRLARIKAREEHEELPRDLRGTRHPLRQALP